MTFVFMKWKTILLSAEKIPRGKFSAKKCEVEIAHKVYVFVLFDRLFFPKPIKIEKTTSRDEQRPAC